MGYRSDVAYMITGTREDILTFVAKCRLTYPATEIALKGVKVAMYADNERSEQACIAFYTESCKWFDDYEDVKSHKALWKLAEHEDEDTFKLSGLFIRLGEDDNDTEERSFGDDPPTDYIYTNRFISFELDLTTLPDIRDSTPCPLPTSLNASLTGVIPTTI
jgi:hypothetical protein